MNIAFIGIGVMGAPMAGHLAKDHNVIVHNRSADKAAAWSEVHHGRVAQTIAEAVKEAELVEVCLPTDADTCAVAQQAFAVMRPGAIFVDHGSGSRTLARQLAAQAADCDLAYLDAPVTGGRGGAEKGQLAVMVGGEAETLLCVEPAFRCFASDVRLMGPAGSGHATKMVNVIIGHVGALALAEGLGFAIRAGLDPTAVVDVLMGGSSRSWMLENRARPMIDRDYRVRYPIAFARKDIGNVLAEAEVGAASLPFTEVANHIYAALEERGMGGLDTASIIEFFVPNPS